MSLLEFSIKKLESNSEDVYNEAVRLLIKIVDNVLKDPTNKKIRVLQKHNATISKKLICVQGGTDCLKLIGFVENETSYTLPNSVSESHLKYVRDVFTKRKRGESINLFSNLLITGNEEEKKLIRKVELPRFKPIFSHPFLSSIEKRFHDVLVYEDKDLQERARSYIPIRSLEYKAQKKLRDLQGEIKKKKLQDAEIALQDVLLIELLAWFKESFFTWVDSPDCSNCGNNTKMSHMSNDPNILIYTDRVEMHLCEFCKQYTPFPRYNDLNILLETRKGRCGEWANVFTLFCRCMDWDARYVVDETDHVWTEVYSFAQKRWLHCDPCENVCDTPLIYESGWNKKLSYIIAYSADEVQDVTWRYSSRHKELLTRRDQCDEMDLIMALMKLREERQKNFSDARKKYLVNRLLAELIELMQEKQPNDGDKQGRLSGSSTWRLARGEIQANEDNLHFVWLVTGDAATIRYSSAMDEYEFIENEKRVVTKKNWFSGVFQHKNMFRKQEQDWKMVYLCRKENESEGFIKWKIAVDAKTRKVIDTITVTLDYTTYENGEVNAVLESDEATVPLTLSSTTTSAFAGNRSFEVTLTLTGGNGSVAWQHAQLFRQGFDSNEYPFTISITLRDEKNV